VSPSYFSMLRLRMARGRALSDRDTKGMPPVLVINERLAKREFENQDPIGQQLLIQEIIPGKSELGPEVPWHIVGVVYDEKSTGLTTTTVAGGARLRTGHSVNLAALIVPIVHRCALAINARGALDAAQAWPGLKGTDRRGRL
jgi:MacB-like periplasmic core domain